MFNFLKNQRKIIIFDIGSQKIGAISFKIINSKPIIFDMEYQKNNLDESKPHFLSNNIKKIFQKISKKNEKYAIYCNITDPRVVSKKNKTQIKAGKLGISKKDVRKIFKKCIFESKISGKNLLHSYPLNFIIDNKKITDEPLNKYCENLGINCFNLFVDKNVVKNLNLNFEKNKLHVKSYFDSGIASSLAFLSDQEKKDGVLNIDIGARTSKVVDSKKKKIIIMNLLYGIIRPRYDEILEIIRDNVFDEINTRVGIKSVVLTGGASKIYGLKVLCENILNRKTRIGQIENSSSYFYCKPEFSTLLGMINLIKNQEYFDIFKSKNDNKLSIFIERLDKWIEESYV